jgi:hypothetical protein
MGLTYNGEAFISLVILTVIRVEFLVDDMTLGQVRQLFRHCFTLVFY